MKYATFFLVSIFLLFSSELSAQAGSDTDIIKYYGDYIFMNLARENVINVYKDKDFSVVWKNQNKSEYLGYIGNGFQRIRIKLVSIKKDNKKIQEYRIEGKSARDNNVSSFKGTFKINEIRLLTNMHWGCDDEYKNKGIRAQGVVIGRYELYQDKKTKNSGYFSGVFSALWYMDKKGNLKFDDIEDFGDSYRNNQFVGTWRSYSGNSAEKCNWGDHRIPDSGDLDVGTGGFAPNEKYIKNGWESFQEAHEQKIVPIILIGTDDIKSSLKPATGTLMIK